MSEREEAVDIVWTLESAAKRVHLGADQPLAEIPSYCGLVVGFTNLSMKSGDAKLRAKGSTFQPLPNLTFRKRGSSKPIGTRFR